ncbi:MAG: T3SS effector HopA1 family protein, partial [Myxococcota bacterium]
LKGTTKQNSRVSDDDTYHATKQGGGIGARVYINAATDHVPAVWSAVRNHVEGLPGISHCKVGGHAIGSTQQDTIVIYVQEDGMENTLGEVAKRISAYHQQHREHFVDEPHPLYSNLGGLPGVLFGYDPPTGSGYDKAQQKFLKSQPQWIASVLNFAEVFQPSLTQLRAGAIFLALQQSATIDACKLAVARYLHESGSSARDPSQQSKDLQGHAFLEAFLQDQPDYGKLDSDYDEGMKEAHEQGVAIGEAIACKHAEMPNRYAAQFSLDDLIDGIAGTAAAWLQTYLRIVDDIQCADGTNIGYACGLRANLGVLGDAVRDRYYEVYQKERSATRSQ